jgi:alpha-L-fucosidase
MRLSIFIFLIAITCLYNCTRQSLDVLPTPQQVEWINQELGVIIHMDINIYAPETFDYAHEETLPPVSVFNPSKLNTDQWILAAKSAGAKYAVLTAKHGTGFALWHTKANDYHTGNSPAKIDIVESFIKSCKKYGLKPGLYYNTNMNTLYEAGYVAMTDEKRLEFNKIVYQQLSELWLNYGELFEIWFDGGVMSDARTGIADKVKELIDKHQPNALLFGGPVGWKNVLRWMGNENGLTPYPHWSRAGSKNASEGKEEIHGSNGDPEGKYFIPGEADVPNRKKSAWNGGWLWKAGEDDQVYSSDELLDQYYTTVGRNSNMLIGMAIDTSGLFPDHDARIFEEFGKRLKAREKSRIAEISGSGNSLEIKMEKPSPTDEIEIQENISKGERIRRYKVEGLINGEWQQVCDGQSVGHKRMQRFKPVISRSLKLTIIESGGKPVIQRFAAYSFGISPAI